MGIKVDIKALATLARVKVSELELSVLEEEIPEILGFVEKIKEVSLDESCKPIVLDHHNIMREDESPHEAGLYTKALLASAPYVENGRIKVRQVLNKQIED